MLKWPKYDTKRNRRSIALKRKQTRHMQRTAKDHGTQRNAFGFVMPSGVWYASNCRLSALVNPDETPNRADYWRIVRRHRLAGLNPHPILP